MSTFSHYALYAQEPPEHGGGLVYQNRGDYTPAGREAWSNDLFYDAADGHPPAPEGE